MATATTVATQDDTLVEVRTQRNGFQGESTVDERRAPDNGRAVTLQEYWEDWYHLRGPSYEWDNGILEVKPLSTYFQYALFRWFMLILNQYLIQLGDAELVGLETGFQMHIPDPQKSDEEKAVIRKPDLAVILGNNPVTRGKREHSFRGIFDVCIEVISDSKPSEIYRDTVTKKAEYEAAGVKEYYILDPDHIHTRFYYLTAAGTYEEIEPDVDGIIRSIVMPGFRFRYSDLSRLPSLEEMALDEVYWHYALPSYTAATERVAEERQRVEEERQRAEEEHQRAEEERQRAEEEHQRAEEEHQRAEEEHLRAELYAAKLRKLGIELDED